MAGRKKKKTASIGSGPSLLVGRSTPTFPYAVISDGFPLKVELVDMSGVEFAAWVRRRRAQMGLSKRELARRLGVQNANIWAWENEKWRPGSELLTRLTGILGE